MSMEISLEDATVSLQRMENSSLFDWQLYIFSYFSYFTYKIKILPSTFKLLFGLQGSYENLSVSLLKWFLTNRFIAVQIDSCISSYKINIVCLFLFLQRKSVLIFNMIFFKHKGCKHALYFFRFFQHFQLLFIIVVLNFSASRNQLFIITLESLIILIRNENQLLQIVILYSQSIHLVFKNLISVFLNYKFMIILVEIYQFLLKNSLLPLLKRFYQIQTAQQLLIFHFLMLQLQNYLYISLQEGLTIVFQLPQHFSGLLQTGFKVFIFYLGIAKSLSHSFYINYSIGG